MAKSNRPNQFDKLFSICKTLIGANAYLFGKLLSEKDARDVFDDKYIDGLNQRVAEAHKTNIMISLTSNTLWAILFLALIGYRFNFTLFGISFVGIPNNKEIILIIATLVGLFNVFVATKAQLMKAIIKEYVQHRIKEQYRKYYVLRYNINAADVLDYILHIKNSEELGIRGPYKLFVLIVFISMIVFLVIAITGGLIINIFIIDDIISNPNLPGSWSIYITLVCLFFNIVSIYTLLISDLIPVQFWNTGLIHSLTDLEKRDPVKYKKEMDKLRMDFNRKTKK